MGYASSFRPCGCRQTRLMEPEENVWIVWEKCAAHYNPEIDDPKILEAARNKRKHDEDVRRSRDDTVWEKSEK